MVSEGALNWTIRPWLRRLITRSISITPSIIIAGAVGREGLNAALNGTQVALSIILPFVSAPLIYFTCRNKYMTVRAEGYSGSGQGTNGAVHSMRGESGEQGVEGGEGEKMRNHWFVTVFAVLTWTVIAAMNVANLVLLGKGQSGT
jgi:metal iron transporter